MTISMLDQLPFNLSCSCTVVLGRLEKQRLWTCETCNRETDLTAEPYKTNLERDFDTATQIDLRAKRKGETVIMLG